MNPPVVAPRRSSALRVVQWLLLALLIPPSLMGQTNFTWIGGNDLWGTPANWSPAGLPGPADTATITNGNPTLNMTATVSNLVISTATGGLIGQDLRSLTVLHSGRWSAGQIQLARITLGSGCVFTLDGAAKTLTSGFLTNQGTIRWLSGSLNLENNQLLVNQPGALLEVAFGGSLLQNGPGSSEFRNAGTYLKSSTQDTNTIQIVSFINTGKVWVSDQGTLRLKTSSFRTSGPENRFLAEEGSQIELPAGVYQEPQFIGTGRKTIIATGNGQAEVTGRILATNLVYTGGYWFGTSSLEGTLEWRGGSMAPQLTIPPGSTLVLAGPGAKSLVNSSIIKNAGVTRWTDGRFNLENNPTFHNLPGGLFELSFDGILNQSGPGTSVFHNEGIYRKATTQGTNIIQIVSFVQAGRLEVLAGTTRIVGSCNFAPGSSFRTLIGGPNPGLDFGQLQVSGSTTLSGTLELGLLNGFTPSTNQTFPIILSASRSGTFASFLGGFIAEGFYFRPTYPATGVRLEVIDGTARFAKPVRTNGQFNVQIQGVINGAYQIESSTNLLDWSILATNTIPIGGVSTWVDPAPPILPRQFYRAVFLP